MAKSINRLDALTVKNASFPEGDTRKRVLLADGDGLYLQITSRGSRSWLFRYTIDEKTREMGLGPLREGNKLAEARRAAADCRRQLAQGLDPLKQRDVKRDERRAGQTTFKECAKTYISIHSPGWKSEKHALQWTNTLEAYAYPVIGDKAVRDVDDADILSILEPIWLTKNETASRVRGRVEMVLDWAKARKLRTGENPARWRGNLEFSLAKRAHIAPVQHHPALPYERVPAFIQALRERPSRPFRKEQVTGDEALGRSTLAFEFLILSWMRTDAVQGMRWPEVSFEDRVWSVPPERMKGRRAGGKVFRVPLSVRMLEILNLVRPEVLGDELVFPGFREGRPMSNMTFEMIVRRMNEGTDKDGRPPRWHDPTDGRAIVPHGFRSSAKDWSAELGVYPGEVTEMALAHAIASEVEGAYRRGDLLERRRQLMEDWSAFVSPTAPPSRRPANDLGEAPVDSHRSTA